MHFRVWAPDRKTVEVLFQDGRTWALVPEGNGYFSELISEGRDGTRYKFRLDGGDAFPDPASRYEPDGPHSFSMVVDPHRFEWTDRSWRGLPVKGQVIYEMHIGTFTKEGTWLSAIEQLPALADTGITVLEVMPIGEFPGKFNWGYDGVHLFAPSHVYGTPDDCRRFVDAAHRLGMAVILDVVYNHLGPDGNYLAQYSKHYFTEHHHTDWGAAINYDDHDCRPVREFFTANAGYWIDEFHMDGLRLDATQDIYDDSTPHILSEITKAVHAAAPGRYVILIGENEPQKRQLVSPIDQGGYGLDALWNDDFHHTAMVRLTGNTEAYYRDYLGSPQEFVSAMKYGYLYQGQYYDWQDSRRGTNCIGLDPAMFVTFIQNHDQVANSARGLRAHMLTSPGNYKAMMMLMLLTPGTPMLFQGQEFAASSPFLYFADHKPEIASLVRAGRREFMTQWRSLRRKDPLICFADPHDPDTFERSKLDHRERETHSDMYQLTRDILKLRRCDPVFATRHAFGIDGAVLSADAFVLRYFGENEDDRLLIVNFGRDLEFRPAPEPLLAPNRRGQRWGVLISTDDWKYGGCSQPPLDTRDNWKIPGQAAVALRCEEEPPSNRTSHPMQEDRHIDE